MPRSHEPALSHEVFEVGSAKTKRRAVKSRPITPRIRILPLTMVMAFLLLGVKVSDLYQSGKAIQLQLQQAQAGTALAADTAGGAMADKDATPKPPPEMTMEEAQQEEEQKIAKLKDENDKISGQKRQFSQIEIDLLQSLRERREEIEKQARELDLKEKLLDETELRINDKISEIKQLEAKVSELLKQFSSLLQQG